MRLLNTIRAKSPALLGMALCLLTGHARAQTSSNMTVIAQYPDPAASSQSSGIWGYSGSDGKEYALYTTRTPGAVVVYEIFDGQNPLTTPKLRGRIAAGHNSTWQEIIACGDYAYKVSQEGSHGLQIIDLSPLNQGQNAVKVTDITTHFRVAHQINCDKTVTPNRLYVSYGNTAGVMIFSLQDPKNPTKLADIAGQAHDMMARGNTLYISKGGNSQVQIYDVSNPSSPVRKGTITLSGYAHNAWPTDDDKTLLTTEETAGRPVGFFNISNLSAPTKILDFRAPGTGTAIAHNVFVNGNYAYVAHYTQGLRVWDISNPAAPVEKAYHRPSNSTGAFGGTWGAYCWFKSGLLIHGDDVKGLMVVKPTGLPSPTAPENRIQTRLSVKSLRNGIIDFQLPENGGYTLSLYNPDGREVLSRSANGSAGMQSLVLDNGKLTHGNYLVTLHQDSRKYSAPIAMGK
jgi:choice-of-anchor B domain-containing protein